MFTSPFLAYHPSFPPLEVHVESQDHVSGIQFVWTTRPLPYDALSKHRAGLMGLALNNNHTISVVADVSQTSQKAGENKDGMCHSQKVCGEKEKSEGDEKDSVT